MNRRRLPANRKARDWMTGVPTTTRRNLTIFYSALYGIPFPFLRFAILAKIRFLSSRLIHPIHLAFHLAKFGIDFVLEPDELPGVQTSREAGGVDYRGFLINL